MEREKLERYLAAHTRAVTDAMRKRDEIIRESYAGESMTIKAIADATGLSTARVHQIIHGR